MASVLTTHAGSYTVTLQQLRRAISDALNEPFLLDAVEGSFRASGGTTTTLAATSVAGLYTADEFKDGWIYAMDNGFVPSSVARERRITAFDPDTNTWTFAPPLGGAIIANDEFEIHQRCTVNKKHRAIQRAIEEGWPDFFIWKTLDIPMCKDEPYIHRGTGLPTDIRDVVSIELEPLYEVVSTPETLTSADSDTLVVTGAGWTTDEWAGAIVAVIEGQGLGQQSVVESNTATTLQLVNGLEVAPTTGSLIVLKKLPEYKEWEPITLEEWRPYGAPFLQHLHIPHRWQQQAGRALRINYKALVPAIGSNEDSTTIIPKEYLVYAACCVIALEWGFDSPKTDWDASQWLGRWNSEERERLRQKYSFLPAVKTEPQEAPKEKKD